MVLSPLHQFLPAASGRQLAERVKMQRMVPETEALTTQGQVNRSGKSDMLPQQQAPAPFSGLPKDQSRLPQGSGAPQPPVPPMPVQKPQPPRSPQPPQGMQQQVRPGHVPTAAPAPLQRVTAPAPTDSRSQMQHVARMLMASQSPAQRAQGMTMFMKASQPTKDEIASQDRERMISVINSAGVDEAAKERARIIAELGGDTKQIQEAMGLTEGALKAQAESADTRIKDALKMTGSTAENAVLNRHAARINKIIDEGTAATGMPGYLTSVIPSTDAYQLATELNTVRAIVGFDKLEQMRETASSGASGLGQVTERELNFLQSVQGSLDAYQDPEILKENIADIVSAHGIFRQMHTLVPGLEQGDEAAISQLAELNSQLNTISDSMFLRLDDVDSEVVQSAPHGRAMEEKYGIR